MLRDFLNAVLPEEGIRCASTNPPWRDFFFDTNEELACYIEQVQGKKDVYFCTATFKQPGHRKGEFALAKKVIYLDIDGVKDYGSVDAGRAAFDKFLGESNWPKPSCIIGSGGGLHCYWILERAVSPEEWRGYALRLKADCEQFGFKVDGSITADTVRVLRPPGSYNHKPDRQCFVDLLLSDNKRTYSPSELPLHTTNGRSTNGRSTNGRSKLTRSDYILPHTPNLVPFISVYDQCEQVRHFAETGLAGETGWWAMAGVFTYIQDGDALFHKFSSIDPEYRYDQAQGKLNDRRKNATGPITCERIKSSGSRADICARCPLYGRIVTPVQVGCRPNGIANTPTSECGHDAYSQTENTDAYGGIHAGGNLPELPDQFLWGPHGELNFIGKSANGGQITISTRSLYLAGRGRDKLHSQYFDSFQYCDTDDGWRTVRVKSDEIANSCPAAIMARKGVSIQSAEYFRLYVARARDMLKSEIQYDQFGWKDDGFLLGGVLHSPVGSAEAPVSPELRERAVYLRSGGAKNSGELKAWSSNIRGLLQPGFEPQQIALLASAAAPLIKFITDAEGGALVHFVSRLSGAGKTKGLEIAASLWGDYNGLRVAMDDTRNFKSDLFGSICHLPILFDELVERDGSAVESLVRIFSGGRDKGRCRVDGSPIENPKRWSSIMLSTANRSLIDLIRSVGGTEAMAARILEFEMEPIGDSRIMAAGERYIKGVKVNCGWAGQELIKAYVGLPKGVLEEAVETSYEEILDCYPKWSTVQRYRARVLGCLRVSGYFLDRLGLIEFDVERLIKWAGDYLDKYNKTAEEEINESALSAFLNEHITSTLVVDRVTRGRSDTAATLRLPARELLVRKEDCEGGMISIDKLTFLKWLSAKDIVTNSYIKKLIAEGVIVNPNKMVLLGEGTPLSGGFVQCIVVNPEKI